MGRAGGTWKEHRDCSHSALAWDSSLAFQLPILIPCNDSLALQGTEIQDEEELEDDGDYEQNGGGDEEDDLDGKATSLHGALVPGSTWAFTDDDAQTHPHPKGSGCWSDIRMREHYGAYNVQ